MEQKKPSIWGILFAFFWFFMFLLAVIGILGDAEKDYVLMGVCAVLALLGLWVAVGSLKERKKKTWHLSSGKKWIFDTMVADHGYTEERALEILRFYIDDVDALNRRFYYHLPEWARHLKHADDNKMTKAEWLAYLESLEEAIPKNHRHLINDIRERQLQYEAQIERLTKENERQGIKPPWIWRKLGDVWGFLFLILAVASVAGYEKMPLDVQDYLYEHTHFFVVYIVALMFVVFGSHSLYSKWFERRYATYHKNEKKMEELALESWVLEDELDELQD